MELNFYDCYLHITGFDVLIINVYNQFLSTQDKTTAYHNCELGRYITYHILIVLCYDTKLENKYFRGYCVNFQTLGSLF